MNLALTMAVLRPGENVSPDMSSYEMMVAHWRGSGNPPTEQECEAAWITVDVSLYAEKRRKEYPDFLLYLDAKVKQTSSNPTVTNEGISQEQKYLSDCLAVKAKYPKPS